MPAESDEPTLSLRYGQIRIVVTGDSRYQGQGLLSPAQSAAQSGSTLMQSD